MRLVIARCQVDYVGRLTAHLPMAPRLLLVKADGSVSIHADDRAYKPLNWMSPPCSLDEGAGVWTVRNKADERLVITIDEVLHDSSHELGVDPGLVKDGVEAHLQELLAAHRRHPRRGLHAGPPRVPDGDRPGGPAVPRRGRGDRGRRGQAARRDRRRRAAHPLPGAAQPRPAARPRCGVFAAQQIKPQARTLAVDRASGASPSTTTRCAVSTTPPGCSEPPSAAGRGTRDHHRRGRRSGHDGCGDRRGLRPQRFGRGGRRARRARWRRPRITWHSTDRAL